MHHKKLAAADDRPAYPALPMFKILLMQRWSSLSKAGMLEALREKLSKKAGFPRPVSDVR